MNNDLTGVLEEHRDPDLAGNALGDLFPHAKQPKQRGDTELVVVGDTGVDLFTAVDSMPEQDSKVIGQHLGIYAGGMGANFATAAKMAAPDLKVSLVSRVGGDDWGALALKQLRRLGVETSRVVTVPDSVTWWCAIGVDDSGEKALMGGRTPASLPIADDLRPETWRQAQWLHILGDITWSHETLNAAREAGVLTSVDVEGSFAATFPDRARALVNTADVAILNFSGLLGLADRAEQPHTTIDKVMAEVQDRPRALLLTLGSRGSAFIYSGHGEPWTCHVQAATRREVVDSTGAGDAFAGTFVASLLSDASITTCMQAAAAAATETIGRLGSRGERLDNDKEASNS